MARRGHGVSNLSNEEKKRDWTAHRRRWERLDAYDTTPARTVLAIVGVAVAIVLVWLEYQGY
jgi:hypothetical protein